MTPVDDIIFARECIADGRAREIRETAGISRQTMATQLGVSLGALTKWEQLRAHPSDPNAERYGALLRRLHDMNQPVESDTA